MEKILFQGDSITDCRRERTDEFYKMFYGLGSGYANLSAGELGYKYPGEYEFLNRGISGNRVTDLYARIKADIINLKPDYMSILIGVNDVWHEVTRKDGVSAERYEKIYDMLISEILEALPHIKIMILEPFVLKGTGTEENWDLFHSEVLKRAAAAKRIAGKYKLKFIPLQEKFDEASKNTKEPYWTLEGVHPTVSGHRLIANEWLKAFEEIK